MNTAIFTDKPCCFSVFTAYSNSIIAIFTDKPDNNYNYNNFIAIFLLFFSFICYNYKD